MQHDRNPGESEVSMPGNEGNSGSQLPAPAGQSVLSPVLIGYIRKLLRQNLDQLESIPGSQSQGEQVNPIEVLDALVGSLNQETANQETAGVASQLIQLASNHQILSTQGPRHRKQLVILEQQLFELLGSRIKPLRYQGSILAVDDTPANLSLLVSALKRQGYEVCSAISGAIALDKLRQELPDLVLLDVMMPEMDGYEVCRHIKAEPRTQDIPVIFISAVGDVVDKVKAFELGAADYITKPFQIAEVLARVDSQIKIRNLQKRLEEQNVLLQQEIDDRRQAEERYRSIVENAVDGIFQITPDGHYVSANLALARMLGYESPQELIATIRDVGQQLYVQPQRRAELAAYMQRYGTVSDFESEVLCKDGTSIWIAEDIRTVRDANNILLYYEGTAKDITERKQTEDELRRERRKTEHLLLNILPQKIAERLKRGPTIIAENFAEVTVLFADIVEFTSLSARISPTDLITLLNQIFSAFDSLMEEQGLEKIKTIGDAYMAVGGLPKPRPDHAQAIADLALSMQEVVTTFKRDTGDPFRLRIGINTGPVVAGVIGRKKFSYDLWGDTVNIASRMESEGVSGGIQVTAPTYEAIQDNFILEPRGTIAIKGRGDMMTYWLLGRKDEDEEDEEDEVN
jgi:PAS domain S-box-containing protein